ncbi:UNVERIFIED_CONTAM: hypothetical protein HDU68_000724 [Siphonaria sp. JEL0065]|nr:hypothetical protein HDU68_000724 [Siphonaria sp. JEL0065]
MADTDRLQIIHFDTETLVLSVLLDDFSDVGAVSFLQYQLVVPNKDSLDGVHFVPSNTKKRIAYKCKIFPPLVGEYESRYPTEADYESYANATKEMGVYKERTWSNVTEYGQYIVKDESEYVEHRRVGTIKVMDRNQGNKVVGELPAPSGNGGIELFQGELIMTSDGGEDACYGEVKVYNWRTGENVTSLPLPRETHGYIEWEWDRGMLPNSSTYFIGPNLSGGNGREKESRVCFYGLPHVEE